MTGLDTAVAAEEKFFASRGAELPEGVTADAVETPEIQDDTPAADPAEKPEAKQEAKPEKQKRLVPYDALHAEREERKKAEKRADRIEELFQRAMSERGQPKAEEKPSLPDFQQDPANHLKARQETAEERLARLENEQRAANQIAALRNHVTGLEHEFQKQAPDYTDAVAFLQSRKVAQYVRSGMSQQEALGAVHNDALMFTHAVIQRGLNPAEAAYELAKDWGYAPKGSKTEEPKGEEKIKTLEKGLAASKGGGGAAAEAPASLKALADMDPSDANFDKEWDRLMRRR